MHATEPSPGLRAGDVIAGRYELLEPAAADALSRVTGRDLLSGQPVELALWPLVDRDWARQATRLDQVAAIADPTIAPLRDFGRSDNRPVAFAVAAPLTGEPLRGAAADDDATMQLLRDLLALSAGLSSTELHCAPLAPELVRVVDGRVRISAIDLIAPRVPPPDDVAAIARELLGAAVADPALRRLLMRWTTKPAPAPREARRALGRLSGGAVDVWQMPPSPPPTPQHLERPLRDLAETGRGSVLLLGGALEQLSRRLRLEVRREGITLIELSAAGSDPLETQLLRGLARFTHANLLWRQDQGRFNELLAANPNDAPALLDRVDRDGLRTALALLVSDAAATRPLVLRVLCDGATDETLAPLRRIVLASAREPDHQSCLVILESTEVENPAVDSLLAGIRPGPSYHEYLQLTKADGDPAPVGPATPAPTADEVRQQEVATTLARAGALARYDPRGALALVAEIGSAGLQPSDVARLAAVEVRTLLTRNRLDDAWDRARAARARLRPGRSAAASAAAAELEVALGWIALQRDDLPAARRYQRAATDRCARGDADGESRATLADALLLAARLNLRHGRVRPAAELLIEASTTARETDARHLEACIRSALAATTLELGDADSPAEAAKLAREAADTFDRLGDLRSGARARLELARALPLADPTQLAEAQHVLGEARAVSASQPGLRRLVDLYAGLIELERGAHQSAIQPLRAAAQRARRAGDPLEARARAHLAEALAAAGQPRRAAREAEAALATGGGSSALIEGIARRALADAALGDDPPRLTVAARELARAHRKLTEVGAEREAEKTADRRRAVDETLRVGVRSDSSSTTTVAAVPPKGRRRAADQPDPARHLELVTRALLAPAVADDHLELMRDAGAAEWAVLVKLPGARARPGSSTTVAGAGPPELIDAVVQGVVDDGPDVTRVSSVSARADGRSAFVTSVPIADEPGSDRVVGLILLGGSRPLAAVPDPVLRTLALPLATALLQARSEDRVPADGGYSGLIGSTPVMTRLFALLDRVASNELPVLLNGESGTGKELVARAIHARSNRSGSPFVPIDCAAIPESLIETELFGHRRGAFTGTVRDRKGLFEEAESGTVFLDEVSNIPLAIQAKLLRVLQEREVRRVGDTVLRPIDARVVAATNRPLESAVRDGSFREDLFFRLNVIEIPLPPLRERKDDIPLLAAEFLARLGPDPKHLEAAAFDCLLAYDWPGNVRELDNEMRRAHSVARAQVIRRGDLSPRLRDRPERGSSDDLPRLHDAVAALERDLVLRALEATGHHRARTAELLGLSHQGLINKIRKYQIPTAKRNKDQRS